MGSNLAFQRRDNLPFAAAWVNLEGTVLSEVRQTQEDKHRMSSLVCGNEGADLTEAESRLAVWWMSGRFERGEFS